MRYAVAAVVVAFFAAASGCERNDDSSDRHVAVPGHPGAVKTAAVARAERRMYDGAPPIVPHGELGASCIACHDVRGMEVEGLGFAPPSPHEFTAGLSAMSRCRQCHVQQKTNAAFVASEFVGFAQDLRKGTRLHAFSPPVIPHRVFMQENCLACHDGPAAREEIRCSHPERDRCAQCHVEAKTTAPFLR